MIDSLSLKNYLDRYEFLFRVITPIVRVEIYQI